LSPGLLSFFTLSSSRAKAPKSSLPPDSNKGVPRPTRTSSVLGSQGASPMDSNGGPDGEGSLRFLAVVAEGGAVGFSPGRDAMAFGTTPLKLGHVPRFRCSEAVREGFDAENIALQREHCSLTALGRPVSGCCTKRGNRCAQYQAPFPLIALFRTVSSPS
jgi:hypothetical protein